MKRPVKPKSWFGIVGSVALSVSLAMTACGGDGDDGDDGDGGGNGGTTTNAGGGTAPTTTGGTGGTQSGTTGGTQGAATGGTSSSTGGVPGAGGVAGRQQFPNLRKNLAPSAN